MSDKVTHTEPRKSSAPQYLYDEEMPQRLIDYFDVDVSELIRSGVTSGGKPYAQIVGNFPTFRGFARGLGITLRAVQYWCDTKPEFKLAWEEARVIQEDLLTQCGLRNDSRFVQFMLKANHGWRDNDMVDLGAGTGGNVTVVFKRGKTKEEIDAEMDKQPEADAEQGAAE